MTSSRQLSRAYHDHNILLETPNAWFPRATVLRLTKRTEIIFLSKVKKVAAIYFVVSTLGASMQTSRKKLIFYPKTKYRGLVN